MILRNICALLNFIVGFPFAEQIQTLHNNILNSEDGTVQVPLGIETRGTLTMNVI